MLRNTRILFSFLLLVALLFGCGDGTTRPDPPPPPPPPPPPAAEISVEVVGALALASGQGNLLLMELNMVESGGQGANLNFIRVEIFRATGEFEERQEIGAQEIIESSGSNRLEANSSRQEVWGLFFRATIKSGRQLRVTVGFTDDIGNEVTDVTDFVFR